MALSREIGVLKRTIARYVLVLFSVFVGLLALPLEGPSYAVRQFLSAKETLIPGGVPVVALGPVAPFVAPITMALLVRFAWPAHLDDDEEAEKPQSKEPLP